jgi:hypothetical protein
VTDDQVDAIFRDFKAAVDRETVAAFDRLRALVSVEVQPDDSLPNDLVGPGRIVKKFGISRQHLYRLCGKHPISEGGFAFWNGKCFLVSLSRAERHFRRNPLRRCETKK